MLPQKNIHLVVILALAAAFLLPGCASQAATEIPVPAISTATAVVSKKTLNIWNQNTPTILNPYFSLGMPDYEPVRIVYEPLADFDKDGKLVPILAIEIPTLENDELAADNKSVTWKLRQDVKWSDGIPFTADDVVFTYFYIVDPEVKAVVKSEYSQVANVEALDDYTVKVTFKDVNPAWALPFVGIRGVILPKHIFEPYKGANARDAHANMVPVGTGPYLVREPGIKPQEVLLLGSQIVKTTKIVFDPNPNYRFPDKIAFKQVVWRGGGELAEANRQLFEEGSLHVSYVIDPAQASTSSTGKLLYTVIPGVERILLNFTDPNKPSADGEYASLQVPHPLFSDKRVRQAIAYAINRNELIEKIFKTAAPAYAILVAPPQYLSKNKFYEYDPEKAKALLDGAGYIDTDGDGFREKDVVRMKIVFRTFIDADRQAAQQIIKENLKAIGIDVELKKSGAGIMFGDDTLNPDSIAQFNVDLLMFRTQSSSFDPTAFMDYWTCKQIPQKANGWKAGNNNERWCNQAYDDLLQQTKTELDPVSRQDMFVKLNDMLVEDVAVIPLVWEKNVVGVNQNLEGLDPTPWDSLTWNIQDWYFVQP